jgi:hypothetical protein
MLPVELLVEVLLLASLWVPADEDADPPQQLELFE